MPSHGFSTNDLVTWNMAKPVKPKWIEEYGDGPFVVTKHFPGRKPRMCKLRRASELGEGAHSFGPFAQEYFTKL